MTGLSDQGYQKITVAGEGALVLITLNRPPANAIDMGLLEELDRALDEIQATKEVRAVIITGSGERMFSGGADINEFNKMSPDEQKRFVDLGCDLYDRIEAFPKPVVAAVNGFALGGGNELAMSCDVRIAAAKARFGLPEIRLGLLPGWGGVPRLTRLIGQTRARELLLTGGMLDAAEAKTAGLVTKVVADADLLKEAKAFAGVLSQQAPLAMAETKRLIFEMAKRPFTESVRDGGQAFLRLLKTKDGQEGTAAFLQKRQAQFRGE